MATIQLPPIKLRPDGDESIRGVRESQSNLRSLVAAASTIDAEPSHSRPASPSNSSDKSTAPSLPSLRSLSILPPPAGVTQRGPALQLRTQLAPFYSQPQQHASAPPLGTNADRIISRDYHTASQNSAPPSIHPHPFSRSNPPLIKIQNGSPTSTFSASETVIMEDDEGYETSSTFPGGTTASDSPTSHSSNYSTEAPTSTLSILAQVAQESLASEERAAEQLSVIRAHQVRKQTSYPSHLGYSHQNEQHYRSNGLVAGSSEYRRPHSSSAPMPYPQHQPIPHPSHQQKLQVQAGTQHPYLKREGNDQFSTTARPRSFSDSGPQKHVQKKVDTGHVPNRQPLEKQYPCPGCDRTFARRYDRNRHARKHTGEKPYPCANPDCNEDYGRPDALQRHYRANPECEKMRSGSRAISESDQMEVLLTMPTAPKVPAKSAA